MAGWWGNVGFGYESCRCISTAYTVTSHGSGCSPSVSRGRYTGGTHRPLRLAEAAKAPPSSRISRTTWMWRATSSVSMKLMWRHSHNLPTHAKHVIVSVMRPVILTLQLPPREFVDATRCR
ncbi:hypothetical protein IG631_07954 [Alternaria alternata]|nr:hypothetical protein IG631_07954 [Alternaria alternata]